MRSEKDLVRIAILDNDILALQMLCHIVSRLASDFTIIWHSTSATESLHRCLIEQQVPDVLIIDMALDDIPGPQVCSHIRQKNGQIGLIGITAYPLQSFEQDMAAAGAQALISKERIGHAEATIRQAARGLPTGDGNIFLPATTAHHILCTSRKPFLPLTKKEKEILKQFQKGIPTEEIANNLSISRNTVFTHTHRALKKLNAKNRTEALAICLKYNLLD